MKRDALATGFALPTPPRRTVVPSDTAEKFTEAEEGSRVSTPVATAPRLVPPLSEAASPAKGKTSSRQRRAELGERVVVYLPPELVTELRVTCARERRSLSDAVTAAVGSWSQHKATSRPI